MADEPNRAQKALSDARHTIAMVDNPRLETVREQLSEILFGDEEHSTAQCLSELRTRKELETRKRTWIDAGGGYRLVIEGAGFILKDHRPGVDPHTFGAATLECALDLAESEGS